jgi:predicted acylesterase/phospholipase RssA
MADISSKSDGPSPFDPDAFDVTKLPDYDRDFIDPEDIRAFENALNAPEPSPSQDDLSTLLQSDHTPQFITALNDWRPVRQRVRKRKRPKRGTDETREGYLYDILKWPLLLTVLGWIIFLGISYLLTRLYIFLYEHLVTWRGRREVLRRSLRNQTSYEEWVKAATKLDAYLGNDRWKTTEEYAYYDSKTIKRVRNRMIRYRKEAEAAEKDPKASTPGSTRPVDELCALVEASIRDNFVGFENPRLYSETYYGTKELVQSFTDEAERSLAFLKQTRQLDAQSKRNLWKHIHTTFGRTALCLSGGATFAYYHFGIAKALLDANLLPQVITGTSGGALVAALLATRTDDELKKLLVPALAHRITACHDSTWTWFRRWWRTGARFDSVDWAQRCSWFTRGSMTFREAYKRTGRILNVSCVPSDPHSPTILANYLTSPDCVIWSAVLASAAVPGILNPVVLLKKTRHGKLEPYSFGHKWKDGSLRTDIPLKALNLHFNVNFSIVSQVNPHINLFFFSSRGTVGRPVTHRKGRGWRGGFLGSATEQYLKLDMNKWLKVLRHLELLPRPMNQDWSQLWLQRFSGTITIWPKSVPSDFYYILSDPTPERLARMIRMGQLSTWPKLKFIANRMKLERVIEQGRLASRQRTGQTAKGLGDILSEDDLRSLLKDKTQEQSVRRRLQNSSGAPSDADDDVDDSEGTHAATAQGPKLRFSSASGSEPQTPDVTQDLSSPGSRAQTPTSSLGARMKSWFSRSNSGGRLGRPKSASDVPSLAAVVATTTTTPPLSTKETLSPVLSAEPRRRTEMHKVYNSSPSTRRGSMIVEMARQSSVFFDDDDFDDDADDDESDNGKTDGILGSDEAGKGHRTPRWSQNWKYGEKNWEEKLDGAVFDDDSDGQGSNGAAHVVDNNSSDEEARTKTPGLTVLG